MITHGIGQEAAVAWLKRRSNETNVKVRELCAELVRQASEPPPT
jgi:hypothetical protein